MGLAASQARLLTITARIADNELRSQTINNAKMRLATQSAQASENYINALNNADLMFQNMDLTGATQNQLLTFNSLTSYSPYNTQYGLVNSSGLALVSEAEADIFKAANGNLEKYLKAHGIEWSTSYYDENNFDVESIKKACADAYLMSDIETNYLFGNATPGSLKALYEKYNAYETSAEYLEYQSLTTNFSSAVSRIASKAKEEIRKTLYNGKLSYTEMTEDDLITKIKQISSNNQTGGDKYYVQLGTKNSEGNYVITKGDQTYTLSPWQIIKTTTTYDTDGNPEYSYSRENILSMTGTFGKNGSTYTFASGESYEIENNMLYSTETFDSDMIKNNEEYNSVEIDGKKYYYITDNALITYDGITMKIRPSISGDDKVLAPNESYPFEEDGVNYTFTYKGYDETDGQWFKSYMSLTREETYDQSSFLRRLFTNLEGMYLANNDYLNTIDIDDGIKEEYLEFLFGDKKDELKTYTKDEDGNITYNKDLDWSIIDYRNYTDLDKILEFIDPSQYSDKLKNLIDKYRVDIMVSVFGEPKYTWSDSTDTSNTGNADAKAQWYTNLFNRMRKGYQIIENGLASSNDWIEFAFNTGLVTMEQVDSNFNWIPLDYKTCVGITERTDNSAAVAKAEAEYNRAMNDIQSKDSIFDMQLKNIDTEHNSLLQEYESIQKVINKNIERTMKFDQSG